MDRISVEHSQHKGTLQSDNSDKLNGAKADSALIDAQVLDSLLSLPDAALQASLCTQIIADLRRIQQALAVGQLEDVAHFAHELKGLTATIGANPLAELSVQLQLAAEMGQACDALVAVTRGQIDAVCTIIEGRARRTGSE
ncbi:MAG: Hpt domain-containing protein [Pararhodobacter sp.]|nr:Hpt domain-containing protein [Pararhodobacter sp.]